MSVNIEAALYNLGQIEFGGKPIPATDELRNRIVELQEGRRVPLVTFNCLETSWRPATRRYPQIIFAPNVNLAVCKYNLDAIEIVRLDLQQAGESDLKVVVPDSELTDTRVFSFAQSEAERLTIAKTYRQKLEDDLSVLNSPTPVTLWSEYCQNQRLCKPADYTKENYDRIQRDPKLMKKVRDQARDSLKFLERNGLPKDYLDSIKEDERIDRTAWYLAMYMGEGQALMESQAIVLNFEDGRVAAWFQRGADGKLPILTPVDPTEFYRWRAEYQANVANG